MESSETNAGAGFSYSKTNLQEAGVDEADIVKTDGKYLYVMKATGSVRLIRAEDKALQTEGTIMLDALNETPQEMYVDGDTLSLIVTGSKTTLNSDAEEDTYTADTENYTKLTPMIFPIVPSRSSPVWFSSRDTTALPEKTAISFICLRSLIRRSAMHRKLMSTFRQSMVQEWSPRIFFFRSIRTVLPAW